jgi:formamidopyrimidine-DNA glycosylase
VPEGPEVETVRRSLEPLLVGKKLGTPWASSKALRRKTTSRALQIVEGRKVRSLGRHGKLMWLETDDDDVGLTMRLGMTGHFSVVARAEEREPHTHVVIPLGRGGRELRYVDVRRFGEVLPFNKRATLDAEVARLGPDPLSFTTAQRQWCVDRLKKTTRPLKDAVLDQKLFAGVGNIYACEALYLARLSPLKRSHKVARDKLAVLVDKLGEVLRTAVDHRGTTFSDFVDAEGLYGDNQSYLHVFQREGEPCGVCGRAIERVAQSGRSTFLCRTCQSARH